MIRKSPSFARALAVLSIAEADDRTAYMDGSIFAEAYQNGREQGVTLSGFDSLPGKRSHAYFIAEHRNSDEIVIYRGDYAMQSISDDAYSHPNWFKSVDEAAEWLIESIINDITLANAQREERKNQKNQSRTRGGAAAEEAASNAD